MKVRTELPESTRPEHAWIENGCLMVQYHKFQETGFVYVDAHAEILLPHIVDYSMVFGKRKAFKKLLLFYRHSKNRAITKFTLSNNHKELAVKIYQLLKAEKILPRKEVI